VCVCVSGFRSYIASMCYSNFMVLTSVCTNCQTASDIVAFLDWGASLVAQTMKNLPAMQETWVWSLGQKDPLEKGMAIHSSILAWRIPWTEEPGGLQSMGSQRVRHDWATDTNFRLSNHNQALMVQTWLCLKIMKWLAAILSFKVLFLCKSFWDTWSHPGKEGLVED